MLNPPITGINDLDAWLYQLNIEGVNSGTPTVMTSPISGDPVGYTYQFIHVKYADDNVGGGFSNTPAFKMYWGIYNSKSSTESTNPADYTWFKSPSGFGSVTFLYYQIIGGRQIKFSLATAQPSYKWLVDSGLAIDLDSIVPAATISYNELMDAAVTELKIAASAVTATKINVAALDQALGDLRPNTVSASQIAADAVTELKILNGAITNSKLLTGTITGDKIYANTITGNKIAAETIAAGNIAAGAITAVKIEAGSVTSEKIYAGSVTSDKITVGSLQAITTNMGTLTSGEIIVGTTPYISGTTMTGAGTHLYSNGNFTMGNESTNINYNGTQLTMNGNVVAASNIFPSSLSLTSSYSINGLITYIGIFASTLTLSTSNNIGTFIVTNTSTVGGNLIATGTGRTGVAGGVAGQSQTFAVFDGAGTSYYQYGWSPENEDAKSFTFRFYMPPSTSITFYVNGAKTNSSSTLGFGSQITVQGVRN